VELRDAQDRFEALGIRLYAISYDEVEALAAFAENYGIRYPLLSDPDSEVIRRYGVLNTEVRPGDLPVYGVPFPGSFVTDEDGVVIEKFFYDSYKRRDSAETLIDAALGKLLANPEAPRATGGDEAIRVSAFVHGGRGTLRQGIHRKLVVRFELRDGLHLYGEPVPDGMVATSVEVHGPEGLVTLPPILPPTQPLRLEALDLDLNVWSGVVDLQVPFYPRAELVSECRPVDRDSVPIEVTVRYQACDDATCFPPKTETFALDVGLEPVDMPNLRFHGETGQWKSEVDGVPHLRRLILRGIRRHPLGALRSFAGQVWLMLGAQLRWRLGRGRGPGGQPSTPGPL
jgi:peroxiredoxin